MGPDWESTKVSHKRVFALLTPEIRGWKMAQMLQKPVFALPGCQRTSVNTLLCDTLGLADGCYATRVHLARELLVVLFISEPSDQLQEDPPSHMTARTCEIPVPDASSSSTIFGLPHDIVRLDHVVRTTTLLTWPPLQILAVRKYFSLFKFWAVTNF